MNINKYKLIDYTDNEPHTATVAEHIANLARELREFCATANHIEDYTEACEYIEDSGAAINALYDHNMNDIVTITFADWSGFIINEEED